MQDILKKYRKNKITTNINIVLASLVLAIWINFLVLDWTNIWQNLKTSILNSEVQNKKSDLSLENLNWKVYIISNKNISNLESLSFSLAYNPSNISINNIKSEFWDITILNNTPWISSVILTTDKPLNISNTDKLWLIEISKKDMKYENINVINANFKDSNSGHYNLSTSWIIF